MRGGHGPAEPRPSDHRAGRGHRPHAARSRSSWPEHVNRFPSTLLLKAHISHQNATKRRQHSPCQSPSQDRTGEEQRPHRTPGLPGLPASELCLQRLFPGGGYARTHCPQHPPPRQPRSVPGIGPVVRKADCPPHLLGAGPGVSMRGSEHRARPAQVGPGCGGRGAAGWGPTCSVGPGGHGYCLVCSVTPLATCRSHSACVLRAVVREACRPLGLHTRHADYANYFGQAGKS